MKKFFKSIGFFLIPVAIVCIIILPISLKRYQLSEAQFRKAYQEDLVSYSWIKKVGHVDGFLVGGSALEYGVSASQLGDGKETWVNLSMEAQDPILSYLKLTTYWDLKKPATVLLGLDPWFYSKKMYAYRDHIMYMDLNAQETLQYHLTMDKSVIYVKCRTAVKDYLGLNKPKTVSPKTDTVPSDLGSVKLMRSAVNFQAVNDDWFEINKYDWSDLQFEYLKKIKDYCNQNKINLIFVISPKRNDFIKAAQAHFSKEYAAWWDKLYATLPGEKIIGHYSDLSKYNQDSNFAEAYHLNNIGQVNYTNVVKAQMKTPGTITPKMEVF